MLRAVSQSFPIPPGYSGQVQPYVLSRSAIPFIGLSSGSVSAAGAISGITALPVIYPKAYCWFPANALATAIAAGWYYCTFSSTTAGTAFLNTYTSGVPSIPASPTAVTDGKGGFLGDTGEEFAQTITVPGNSMGPNGQLRIVRTATQNNTANAKSNRMRFSGNVGTILFNQNAVSTATRFGGIGYVNNLGLTNSQIMGLLAGSSVADSNAPTAPGAVDTTADTTVVISMTRATATDNMITESYSIEVLYGA